MIDLFSSQFEFFINKKRNGRHTIYGKTISILIGIVSCSYLLYMCIKLRNNEILPKIVELTTLNDEFNTFHYEKSPISIDLTINDKPYTDYSILSKYFKVFA